MKLPLPRVACPHSTSAATTSRPKPCPCALSLSQRPSSGETESASSNEAMPRHSLLSSRRMTKENLFGSGACTLFSHRVTYSLHDGGSHGMNLAMAGVMHPKTSCASIIWNWLSFNLGDWTTIIVSAYQRRIIRELIAGESRRLCSKSPFWQSMRDIAIFHEPFEYLRELQRHSAAVVAHPGECMPWNRPC